MYSDVRAGFVVFEPASHGVFARNIIITSLFLYTTQTNCVYINKRKKTAILNPARRLIRKNIPDQTYAGGIILSNTVFKAKCMSVCACVSVIHEYPQ